MPNPLDEDLSDALWTARYNRESVTKTQLHKILAAAESYIHFTWHPASTERIIKQLRQVRKAVRGISKERSRGDG